MSEKNTFENGLTSLTTGILGADQYLMSTPVNQTLPMMNNNTWNLLFYNRILLNQLYISHGLIQTLVGTPVDDSFRAGLKILSEQLDEKQKRQLEIYLDRNNVWEKIQQTLKWARLFGGAGLVIITGTDPTEPLELKDITKYTKLDFYSADLWELNRVQTYYNVDIGAVDPHYRGTTIGMSSDENPYLFYGIPMHISRVLAVKGEEAPSLMRPRMRGWGMSILERFIASFNMFLKNTNVVYELLDESKLDVFNLDQFKASLLTDSGTNDIMKRMQLTTMLKNFLNILIMDKEDKFEQKQIHFGGLGDILTQIRQNIAADMKMPITKIFGVSSAGFNSGEDDIENYNSMIEGEVRSKSKHLILRTLEVVCQKVLGFVPDDLEIKWNPLRLLSASQEEAVKTRILNRVILSHKIGAIGIKTVKECINADNLLPVTIDESDEFEENLMIQTADADTNVSDSDDVGEGKDMDKANQQMGVRV